MPNQINNHLTCPFCRQGIEESAFLSTVNFLVIYNIAPVLPGHSLVISRRHVDSLMELSDSELEEFTRFSRKVTKFLLNIYKGDGFDWSIQENEVAGQSVPHLHLHIVVRHPNDLAREGEWYPLVKQNEIRLLENNHRKRLTDEEYSQLTRQLRNEAAKTG